MAEIIEQEEQDIEMDNKNVVDKKLAENATKVGIKSRQEVMVDELRNQIKGTYDLTDDQANVRLHHILNISLGRSPFSDQVTIQEIVDFEEGYGRKKLKEDTGDSLIQDKKLQGNSVTARAEDLMNKGQEDKTVDKRSKPKRSSKPRPRPIAIQKDNSTVDKCVPIIQTKHALYLQNKHDIESVYIMGKNLNQIKPMFNAREWTGYVTGNLGVDMVIARRSMRMALMELDEMLKCKTVGKCIAYIRKSGKA